MDQYLLQNQAHWNDLVPIHERSAFYDVEGFRAGRCTLKSIEREEVGDVAGKSLLHLQCHFGMDTLSWARLGARVTGVDFSAPAIQRARALARELGIEARFVHSDLYSLPEGLDGTFDIVFTSYGVLCWLPDLTRWAAVIARFLRPGGTFYIVEGHPAADLFDDTRDILPLQVAYAYFHDEPLRWDEDGSYADRDARVEHTVTYEWTHGLGDVVSALAGAGLRIEFLHEFPFSMYRKLPGMEEHEDGFWWLNGGERLAPFLFSLKATK